ncbi:MAG: Xaa-Pro aminopeptidase [Flavobacteriaceae bacterium]|nr:Xaa-Pro aminopeptidase [Flavobacteriaceae bacterium]
MIFNKKYLIFLITAILISSFLNSQNIMLNSLTPDFHKSRRDSLKLIMPENSIAVLFSNPKRNRANDVNYVYHQDPNFYYLTGLMEPNSALIIFSEEQKDSLGYYDEIIYVQEKDPYSELWNARRLGVKGAKKLKIDRIKMREEFILSSEDYKKYNQVLFFDFKNDIRDSKKDPYDLFDLKRAFKRDINFLEVNSSLYQKTKDMKKNTSPTVNYNSKKLGQLLGSLRESKTKEELEMLNMAIQISSIGQIEVMKAIKPGFSEREIQGIHEFVFKKYGAAFEGYPSIIGAGHNGCVLHYKKNNDFADNNELILMDVGAEFHGYTADVTRTIPVNGIFSEEQKKIYEIVYKAQEAGISYATIGSSKSKIHSVAYNEIAKGLINLKIIDNIRDARIYFPHGTVHHIGLDVHDLNTNSYFKENSVITVEPGIYIPEGSKCDKKWWGIAIRIEDDVLISKNGPVILSDGSPRKWNEIEDLMKQPSVLDDFELPKISPLLNN